MVLGFLLVAVWLDVVSGRSWQDISLLHGYTVLDYRSELYQGERDPLFTPMPSNAPSVSPTLSPTDQPSVSPTDLPSTLPSQLPTNPPDPFPPAPVPNSPEDYYYNYDTSPTAQYGPGYPGKVQNSRGDWVDGFQNNAWGSVTQPPNDYWREFDDIGFGPWKGVLANRDPRRNFCARVGMQSPIDLRENAECEEFHEVRSKQGDFRIQGDQVQKQILGDKLRLLYARRPCADYNTAACSEPDPPYADFPNGWGGFADALHLDIKIPGEHTIEGEAFDAEMQIYHLHPSRKRVPTQAVSIRATDTGYNYYFEYALQAFEGDFFRNQLFCEMYRSNNRKLVSDFYATLGANVSSAYADYTTWGDVSSPLQGPHALDIHQKAQRGLQIDVWDPYHPMLIPSIWFWRYDGSLTSPPCGEFVTWFISDIPMEISFDQLERLKKVLFTNVTPKCEMTSLHYNRSVARPIQDAADRPVWKCRPKDFGPDQ